MGRRRVGVGRSRVVGGVGEGRMWLVAGWDNLRVFSLHVYVRI